MNLKRGAEGLLLLAEIVVLVLSIVLGTIKKLGVSGPEKLEKETSAEYMVEETVVKEPEEAAGEEEVPAAEPESFSAEVKEKIGSMTMEEKVAQLFLTTPEELTGMEQVNIAGAGTRNALEEYPVGGLIYSEENYQGREQFNKLLEGAEQFAYEGNGIYLFMAVTGVDASGESAVAFSPDYEPKALTELMAAGQISAEPEQALLPVSFPRQQESIGTGTVWVMLDTGTDAGLTGAEGMPCTLSEQTVQNLRNSWNYQGLILSGNLSEEAITASYSAGEAAVMAVRAGADLLYQPEDFEEAYLAVLEAANSGEIAQDTIDRAVGHILTQKFQIPAPVVEQEEAQEGNAESENERDNAE